MSVVSEVTPVVAPKRSLEASAWISGVRFDLILILGVAALALSAGFAVEQYPAWFTAILLADLWFLGYHHVVATFTRLAFDSQSLREYRFLVFGLPVLVVAATVGIAFSTGAWAIATIYFYWQWFHYTRQSYGIAKCYMRKEGLSELEMSVTTWALYLVPVFGLFYRSSYLGSFLGMKVKMLPMLISQAFSLSSASVYRVWEFATSFLAFFAVCVVAYWVVLQLKAWRGGKFRVGLTLYMMSHFAVFLCGYYLLRDINHGWLVLNIWHNAQYILFVWWFNTKRFEKGVEQDRVFLSWLSQKLTLNTVCYFAVTLGVSTVLYYVVGKAVRMELFDAIPSLALITFQSVNFHHYVVDGMIWKRKRSQSQNAPAAVGTAG